MAATDVSTPEPARAFAPSRRTQIVGVQVATFLAVWACWEALSRSGLLYDGVVPSSLAVFAAIGQHLVDPVFWDHMGRTAYEVGAGFAIGTTVGVALGLLMGMRRFLAAVVDPCVNTLAATPKIVFLPIMMVLFGVGAGSKVAMAAISAFFPVAVSVYRGTLLVNPVLIRVARSYNAGSWRIVRSIYLPSLVPPLLTGLRLGFGVAIVGTLLAETKLSNKGLGYLVIQAYALFDMPKMYALVIVLFVLSIAVNVLIGRLGGSAGDK